MSEPITRQEQLLSAIATGGDIISPITREEMYLAYLAGDTSVVLPEPITRKEQFLYQACLNGGGGGGGTEITDGIVVRELNSDNCAASVTVYCSSNALWKYALAGGDRSPWRSLTSVELPENLTDFSNNYVFYQSALTEITLMNAINVGFLTFYDCKSLKTVNLPKCNILGKETFVGGLVYETINIGSIGYPCTSINNTAFKNHPYSDTITVYTTGAYANTALTNIRNGATNATIILKASEDTTYNDVAYAAGETMITSTVEAAT